MGEVVNLRHIRKRKAREEKEQRAAENRVLHGRSKAERKREQKLAELAESHLEGHRLSPDGEAKPR